MMKSRCALLILVLVLSCLTSSCDNIKQAPQLIEADGQTYVACFGWVWISNEGGLLGGVSTFTVSYSDADGLGHTIKGIKKLSVSDLPRLTPAPLPYPLPDPITARDREGNPYQEGFTYTWQDGSKSTLRGGKWERVMIPNPLCPSSSFQNK
jgi:hypothetical protein